MARAAAAASTKLFSSNFSVGESLKSSLRLNHRSIFHPFSTVLSPKIADKKKRKIESSSSSSLKSKSKSKAKSSLELLKNRTRSEREFDDEYLKRYGDKESHVPVMLGEVLDVFPSSSSFSLRSFVDCTLGAAGHSSAIVEAHPELQVYIGLDVDPVAHERARARINDLILGNFQRTADLKVHTFLRNFKEIKQVILEVDEKLLVSGVDGILMDLGMSSMQVDDAERGFSMLRSGPLDMRMDPRATLRAEDILNSWPAAEVGRILQEYGEESNWYFLQNKIVKARVKGGLHSTSDLVDLIRSTTSQAREWRASNFMLRWTPLGCILP